MKEAGRLESVLEILVSYAGAKKPLDQVCYEYFRARRYIGSKDRQAISSYVYEIMRHRASCDWWALERGLSPLLMGAVEAARIRLLAYLWLFEKMPRDKIGILFSGEKYAPAKLSNKERSIFEKLPDWTVLPPWVEGEFPEWIYPLLKRRFGEKLKEEMQAFLKKAPLDLRVNTLKATREEALLHLRKEGVPVECTSYSPWGLRCWERENITQTETFKNGFIEIQDEGSQMIVWQTDAQPGQTVLDLCAGAGGKTLALAALLDNKGRIVAADTASWRLKRTKERLKRAGAFNVELRDLTSLQDKWLKRQKERFDWVLADVPCSGTGTWRRNPDQKWNIRPQDITQLTTLQKSIVRTAAPLVKPGGFLVYATCSVLYEENQDVIEDFLQNNKEFNIVSCGLEGASYLSMTPLQNTTDGFFMAKIERAKK